MRWRTPHGHSIPPPQDPGRYEQYGYSPLPPNEFGPTSSEYWKTTGEKSNTLYQTIIGLFHPDLDQAELAGVMGASVDKAWSVTTGRPDVVIAGLDTGIAWRDPRPWASSGASVTSTPASCLPPGRAHLGRERGRRVQR